MTVFKNFFGGAFFGGGFFGGGTVQGGGGYHPSQGLGYTGYETRTRTKKEIKEERERLGILPRKVERIIQDVALRQAQKLELDKQKQFEELSRDLRLNKIEWEGKFLEALNQEREKLIDREIASRLRVRLRDQEDMLFLLAMAAAAS